MKAATEGFNAADISRLVSDVKALYAADVIREVRPAALDSYFDRAAAEIRHTKELIASAEAGTLETSEPRGNLYGRKPRKGAHQTIA